VEVQRAHPGRFAIVKPVDPDDPAVADVVADWKNTPGAVAIRIMLTKEAKREPNDPGLDRILREAVRHDFPVNILCWGNLDAGTALIDRHPDTRFIIDHMGIMQPRVPPAPPKPWAELAKVLELAKRPNAVIKVSGACTLSREPYPFPDIWDPLARVLRRRTARRPKSVPPSSSSPPNRTSASVAPGFPCEERSAGGAGS